MIIRHVEKVIKALVDAENHFSDWNVKASQLESHATTIANARFLMETLRMLRRGISSSMMTAAVSQVASTLTTFARPALAAGMIIRCFHLPA